MTNNTQVNNKTNAPPKRWVNTVWKASNYGLMAFSGLCGAMLVYGLFNWAMHFDEWKEDRQKRERIAKDIVSRDEDKDVELERILEIPADQTLQAKKLRKEQQLLLQQQQSAAEENKQL